MRTVYKYAIEVDDFFHITMPAGATILTVQMQDGSPFVWALVDPEAPKVTRRFRLAGTGHSIGDADAMSYVGTFQMRGGALVFHLFAYAEGR